MAEKIPLFYTFGNHMHWVDMEWLWGYHVLPGSVHDMLRFCREAGVKGNVNFDGIGYEKLAAEDPEALAELREAVQSGSIEPVGCSYGQPYGLFHGGESNIRQRVYGIRTVMRLLGVRPKTFWEEEFDFLPQLPQILKGVGFEYASLFFQWTWHTPEVPREEVSVIWWEGIDGSRLKTATRNKLNLHQWPEDMDILLRDLADQSEIRNPQSAIPLVLQWLELMPSPDWMCRSELILPKMKELLSDPRFEVTSTTLGEYLAAQDDELPVRNYRMGDVWHGMTLGKNGDNMRRRSLAAEGRLLTAETLSSMMSVFGRPYAQWDVYPTWELEESWRELLAAQHHDNDECEGLCGHVGKYSYDRSLSLSGHVVDSNMKLLAQRVDAPKGSIVVFNPLGWTRDDAFVHPETLEVVIVRDLPAMGYRCYASDQLQKKAKVWQIVNGAASGKGQSFSITVTKDGVVELRSGGLWACVPGLGVTLRVDGREVIFKPVSLHISEPEGDLVVTLQDPTGAGKIEAWVKLPTDVDALDITLKGFRIPRPDAGLNAAVAFHFGALPSCGLLADHPYGISEISEGSSGLKKYPAGDWMTSVQWFEDVEGAFTSSSFVNVSAAPRMNGGNNGDSNVLIIHDGSQQWFREDGGIRCLLTAYDPWDEDYFVDTFRCGFRVIPHKGLSLAEMWKAAQEFRRWPEVAIKKNEGGDVPAEFSFASCESNGALLTALYREESEDSRRRLEGYAGRDISYPFVARLVEFDGKEAAAKLTIAGKVDRAMRSNLMGESIQDGSLQPENLEVTLRPHEIATVYLDVEEGRKQVRDLDSKRKIWATVHRV